MEASSVAKGTLQIASTNVIQYLIMGLFYVAVTKTNALTPEDLGILSVLSFISSTLVLSTLALPTALTKFVSEHLGRDDLQRAASVQRTVTRIAAILSLVGMATTVVASGWLSQYFWGTTEDSQLIVLIALSAFLVNLTSLYNSSLRALRLFGKMALVTVIYVLSSRVTAMIMALLGFGVSGVVIGYILGSLAGLTMAVSFVRGKFSNSSDNKTPIRPLLRFSLPLFLSSLALLVLSQADIIVLASVVPNYALVGIYSVAVKSLLVLSVIWQPIMFTIFPTISARFGLQDSKGVSNAVKMTSRYLAYTLIPCCVMLAVVAPTALDVFYGSEYVPGATALAILAFSIIILTLFTLLTTTLTAMGKTQQVLQINLVSALLAVVFLLSLVPSFEIIGAAVTRLAVRAIGLLLTVYVLQRYVNVQLDREALWKSTLASITTVPFLLVMESTMTNSLPVIAVLALEIIGGGLIYLAALYALKALNGQDFELLRQSFPKPFSKAIDALQAVMDRK